MEQEESQHNSSRIANIEEYTRLSSENVSSLNFMLIFLFSLDVTAKTKVFPVNKHCFFLIWHAHQFDSIFVFCIFLCTVLSFRNISLLLSLLPPPSYLSFTLSPSPSLSCIHSPSPFLYLSLSHSQTIFFS